MQQGGVKGHEGKGLGWLVPRFHMRQAGAAMLHNTALLRGSCSCANVCSLLTPYPTAFLHTCSLTPRSSSSTPRPWAPTSTTRTGPRQGVEKGGCAAQVAFWPGSLLACRG